MSAIVTDSRPVEEPKDPEGDAVFQLFRLVADPDDTEEMRHRYLEGGLRYVDAKRQLVDVLVETFDSARCRYVALLDDPGQVEQFLSAGADRVWAAVDRTLTRVRTRVGVDQRSARDHDSGRSPGRSNSRL